MEKPPSMQERVKEMIAARPPKVEAAVTSPVPTPEQIEAAKHLLEVEARAKENDTHLNTQARIQELRQQINPKLKKIELDDRGGTLRKGSAAELRSEENKWGISESGKAA
jgi:hypothetical protein